MAFFRQFIMVELIGDHENYPENKREAMIRLHADISILSNYGLVPPIHSQFFKLLVFLEFN